VGVAQLQETSQFAGLRQFVQILTMESLARVGEDGRMQPWLAESWTTEENGRIIRVKLRPGVKFSDGSILDAKTVAEILATSIGEFIGPLSEDLDTITPSGTGQVEIRFKRPSNLHVEALETTITKPGKQPIGTGAYVPVGDTELRASADYYLGKPSIERIVVSNYPSLRTAWAEALRGNLDLLYDVSTDALDSLDRSTTISTHIVARRYQHVVVLNSKAPALHSVETRRALNNLIDRTVFVKSALNGYGTPSSGPIWPHYWALPPVSVEPHHSDSVAPFRSKLTFTCLVDSGDERIALEVKRQLAAFGIDMKTESVSRDQIHKRVADGAYDAALVELISGPTFLRPYMIWYTKGAINLGKFGNSTIDAALERAHNAEGEEDFKKAVAGVQRAFQDDPPAIFLAWNQRARAVSNRFVVPPSEPGRDILSTLRAWRPVDAAQAGRN